MNALSSLLDRAKTLNEQMESGELVCSVLESKKDDIEELQEFQMFEGKAGTGKNLRPYYTEDLKPGGYFRTIEDAQKYAAWKQNSIPYPMQAERYWNAPNLYINGKFHGEIEARFFPELVAIMPRTPYAANIMNKYGNENFGLTWENWGRVFTEKGATDALKTKIKEILYETD